MEIVLPFVAMLTIPVADRLDVSGTLKVIVETFGVMVSAPKADRLDVFGTESVTVACDPAAAVLWLAVMAPAATNMKFPVLTVPVEPAVLPIVDTPAKTPPSPAPPPDGTETTTDPLVIPTLAMPAPAKIMLDALYVPLLLCVVFEVA